MYDGNQVVRVVSKYKKHDAYKIGLHYDKDDDINYYEMESYAYDINRKYDKEKDKSDDFEIGL